MIGKNTLENSTVIGNNTLENSTVIGNNMEIKIISLIANHIIEVYTLKSIRTTRAIKAKIIKIRASASIITIKAAITKAL